MLRPSSIIVRNVRTFAGEHTLNLHDRLTVIVGANNSGKSSLLRALFSFSNFAELTDLGRVGSTPSARLRFPIRQPHLQRIWKDAQENCSRLGLNFPGWGHDGFYLEARGDGSRALGWGSQQLFFNENELRGRNNGTDEQAGRHGADQNQLSEVCGLMNRSALGISLWSHSSERTTHPKRMSGLDVAELQRSLLFLRLRHPEYFERYERAITTEFPEFLRIAFNDDQHNNNYVPHLQLGISENLELARASFGAGAWAFVCVLAAAYVTHATGGRVLLLDEPTLYMHPQLERTLLRELGRVGTSAKDQLQLIAASHSPILVDAAAVDGGLRIVDWLDRKAASAQVVEVPELRGSSVWAAAGTTNSSIAEVVYAETILFVEGPSDVEALSVLANGLGVRAPCRLMPLQQTSWYTSKRQQQRGERFAVLSQLAKLRPNGYLVAPRLALDEDQRTQAEPHLQTLPQGVCPEVQYFGDSRSDLEGLFCVEPFLVQFFEQELKAADKPADAVSGAVKSALSDAEAKGSTIIYSLFQSLLAEPEAKPTQLPQLAQFLVDSKDQPWAEGVLRNLAPVLAFVDATRQVHRPSSA